MSDKIAIRTSDRATFKKCRQYWDMSSPLRLKYQSAKPASHFVFGSAWHAAMESWYAPTPELGAYQSEGRTKWAKETFTAYINRQRRELIESGWDGIELDVEYDEMLALGHKMIDYYVGWAKIHDDFEPVTVEHEFEVPVTNPRGDIHLCMRKHVLEVDPENNVFEREEWWKPDWSPPSTIEARDDLKPVYYQGRIDGLVRDFRGFYYVLEHKSAAKEGPAKWLAINDQVSSYEWALQKMLGIPIKGTIYTIAFKRAPEKPKVLKDGSISCDKRQTTTASLFVEAIEEAHPFRPAAETITDSTKYFEYHQFLTNPDVAPKYIERHILHRNPHQLEDVGQRIAMEAQDMLNDPFIYPTISSINCNSCAFYAPCQNKQDGGDWQYQLASEYAKRS
jgi:hypothetical protein